MANGGTNSGTTFTDCYINYDYTLNPSKTSYLGKVDFMGQIGQNFSLVMVINGLGTNSYRGPFGKGTPTTGKGMKIYTSNPASAGATFQLMTDGTVEG